jgi:hypothetical protein
MVPHTFNAIEGLISEVFTKYYKVLLYFIYIGLFPQRYFVPSWFWHINWSEQTISSNQYTVGTNQTYLAIASANGLEQIIDFPTRNENTLDLIFTFGFFSTEIFCAELVLA